MLEKKKSKKLQKESQVKNAGSEAQDAEMAPADQVQPSEKKEDEVRPPQDLLRVEGNLEVREILNQIHHAGPLNQIGLDQQQILQT